MASTRSLVLALLATLGGAAADAAELVVAWAPLKVPVEGYQVERRVEDARDEFAPIARVDNTATRFTDRAVKAGVRYCYRIRGVRGERRSPPSPPLCNVATESSLDTAQPTIESVQAAPSEPAPQPAVAEPTVAESRTVEPPRTAAPPQTASVSPARTTPSETGVVVEESLVRTPAPSAAATAAPAQTAAVSPAPTAASSALDPPRSGFREVKAISRPPPGYPSYAQLNGISGWVKLMFTVTADGRTRDIRVVAAEPPGVFDQAAVTAATRFLYTPRLENGKPVDRQNVETEITFTWIDRGGSLTTDRRRRAPR